MSQSLPLRANLEWLKKVCKERLTDLQSRDPDARLSAAQLDVAREYGFPSWRKLKAHVEQVRDALQLVVPNPSGSTNNTSEVAVDDPERIQLFSAVEAGEFDTVVQLLKKRPELAKARDAEGQTVLHLAARYNDPKLGVTLLSFGADPQAKFGDPGHTPMSWAVTCHSIEFAMALTRLGIKADLFCAAGIGALDQVRACFNLDGRLVANHSQTGSSRFDSAGTRLPCPPETEVELISDALYVACRNAQEAVVDYLLTCHPDLSFRAYLGATPLHWAYFGGSFAIITALSQAGADPHARDFTLQCTPRAFGICVAANWGFAFLVRAQLQRDASLAQLVDGPTSPLHEAARSGSQEIVSLLLAAGARATAVNDRNETPLDIAIRAGHVDVAALLQAASK